MHSRRRRDRPAEGGQAGTLARVIRGIVFLALLPAIVVAGRVEIALEHCPDPTILTVRDNGPGVAPELLPRVFERFVRSPDSPGNGLGLPIVADIADAHGGSASIESTPGLGTTIKLQLP